MKRMLSIAFYWLVGWGMATYPLSAQVIYSSSGSTLFRSELKGSVLTPVSVVKVGEFGFDSVYGLDFHPVTGELYGFDLSTGQILRVNTDTGGATPVVSGLTPYCQDHLGPSVPMSFDDSGQLWLACDNGFLQWNGLFLRIDVDAGTVEAGPTFSTYFFQTIPRSLFFIDGAMYLAAAVEHPPLAPTVYTVIEVDPTTGAQLGTLDFDGIDEILGADYDRSSGAVFAGRRLYGPAIFADGIMRLDPSTLAVTVTGTLIGFRGLAVAPIAAAPVPVLDAVGLGFLAILVAAAGVVTLGRRPTG